MAVYLLFLKIIEYIQQCALLPLSTYLNKNISEPPLSSLKPIIKEDVTLLASKLKS